MDKVVVKQFQDEILDALDDILSVNEISLDLYFSSVVPRDFTEEEVTEEEETSTELSVEGTEELSNELSIESDINTSEEIEDVLEELKMDTNLYQRLVNFIKGN